MADTDAARIGDIKIGLDAVHADMETRATKTELEGAVTALVGTSGERVRKLTADLDRVRRERDAAVDKVEILNGEIRQLNQVIASYAAVRNET